MTEEEKKAISRLKLLNRELYIDNCNLVNVNDLSTVLKLIAKLQKENEELKQENKRIKYFSSNLFIGDYIPKKVVKDKIKEIEEDKQSYYYYWFLEERDIEKTINILQEILGGEEC